MKNKSLTLKVVRILVLTMIFLLILLLGTSLLFYHKSKQDFKEEKAYAVNICVQTIKEHLNKAELQLIDLMLGTMNESDLGSTNALSRYWAKNRINTAIKNKLSINSDVDCIFVKVKDTWIIKGYNTQLPGLSRQNIMNYLKQNGPIETFKSRRSYWKVTKIQGEAFFYLVYEMSGYMAGALIRVSSFDEILNLVVDQDIESYTYLDLGKDIYTYTAADSKKETSSDKTKFIDETVTIRSPISNSGITFTGCFKLKILTLFFNTTYIMLIGTVFIFMGMLFVLKRNISKFILKPIHMLLKGMHHISNGRLGYQVVEDTGSTEFDELYKSFNRMIGEIGELRIEKYEEQIKNSERRIKLLRMQIKPHFYLNAITTIRSMTYQDRDDDIRAYLDSLSEHLRYMLKVNNSEVKLGEELSHIENYLKMQEIKFPNSAAYYIGCSDSLKEKEIGHLILFTVIENAFKFAMNLYDTMILLIQCEAVKEEGFIGYRVIIEDNGNGFPNEQIDKFRIGNEVEEKQDGRHIGLSNIKKTLELQYGRKDLLRLSNVKPHGARVEIWIPDTKNIIPEEEE